ncbi:hypothetical protein [Burkholderia savannae]|uniref:hypothetical protein n=1 Tax=Burkholderia savannae TaxID=1637837 RepID=UPI0009E7D87B|nr:hypothetical protein [Burkholderia savannae]
MSLIKGSTKWVLFLSARGEPAHRHIFDLAFGLFCLEAAGINIADIHIYIDGSNRASIDNFMKNGTKSSFAIKESKDFFADQQANKYENIVMFVTGHGGTSGIDANPPITPYKLLNCLKSSPNLNRAIVYLGQCYAGIFNYIGVGKGINAQGGSDPEVVFIGATNLHESLSSSTRESLAQGTLSWVANLFLLYVFKWICNPIDVDGDGKLTIMDSYKYAGATSGGLNKSMKAATLANSVDFQWRWVQARNAHNAAPTILTQLAMDAAFTQYASLLEILYVHQECWILNAIPAQKVEI